MPIVAAQMQRLRLARGDSRGLSVRPHPEPAAPVETPAGADPRWVLALRTTMWLQGGRAGILSPEHRRRLLSSGARMGLRPFDANLVIAIVQDAARTGADPLGPRAQANLSLVRAVARGRADRGNAPILLSVSVCLGLALFLALAAWFAGV